MRPARHQQDPAHAQWILVDARHGPKVGLLLAMGNASYHGVAPRNALDHRVAQYLLRQRLDQAVRTGRPADAARVAYAGREWQVRVRPVRAPVSAAVVGALACYIEASADWADHPPPVVGSWEWRITEGGTDHRNVVAWSDETFELYGLAPPEDRSAPADAQPRFPHGRWWDGTYYLNNLVMDSWRPAVREFRDALLRDRAGELYLCSYKAQHRASGEPVALRLAGRADPDRPGWFRGLVTRDAGARENVPVPAPGPLVRALLLASRDPVVVVDRVLEELESANALFDALNLAVPSDHHIRKLVHPFDVPAMSKLLNAAAADPDHVVGPQRLRLATLSAEVWREFDVIAVGGAASDGPARHVVCRLAAV
ncbi:hypothetical protein [Amycolatopsis sp. ATCC 39116]|uniref:hypothetical protein n=1 Tax=Amycolatopsis sp. (strain ATCC 39116 / 75iv2) TaxID=385957 RepID=UPI0002628661|nr:hypothetical protein [Amycolatopsis sp. ATCC 39116]